MALIRNRAKGTWVGVRALNDREVEPVEEVIVSLDPNPAYFIDPSASTATVSIFDNDR